MSQLRRHGCGSAIVDLFRFHWFRFGVRTRALWSLRRTGTRLLQHELASVETRRGHMRPAVVSCREIPGAA